MKAKLEFNLPEENENFEMAMYSQQMHQTLANIKAKVKHNVDKEGVPNQRRQIYAEINNLIIEELIQNGVAHLF